MIALVLSRARHLLSRSVLGSSLAGDGLLVRLRSTSIGLLGVVTAVGLGLVAFISQLGWPGVFNAPIPGSPHEAATVHGAVALTRPSPRIEAASPALGAPARTSSGPALSPNGAAGDGRAPVADSGLGGSHDLGVSAGAQAPSQIEQPPPVPAPEPASQPVATVPAATPTAPQPSVTGGPSTSGTGSGSKDDSKTDPKPSHGTAGVKPSEDTSGKPVAPSPEKPKDDEWHYWKTKTYPDPTKAGYWPSKPSEDPAEVPSKDTVPTATTPPSKDSSEDGAGGDEKDAGYAGKSDWFHH
jgi:hypothetical protein